MGTETYPKKSHKVGEQQGATFVTAKEHISEEYHQRGSETSYPNRGHKGPNDRHVSRESKERPFANGGAGNYFNSVTYKGKGHSKFPSEQGAGKIKSPTSDMPEKA